MSQPSHDSDKQSKSPQSRIDQHSSGDSIGGQQAAIGNNINQNQNNSINFNIYNYSELQDEDLEPLTLQGKLLSYFSVFIILTLTLIFWFFFGLFTSFPFPYRQGVNLVFSCFTGKIGAEVNRLQKQLQQEDIGSQSINELNKLDFQARLYLRTLEHLGADKTESHERLAKTIVSLKQKRYKLWDEIRPRQSRKYQTVTKAQDFFESITFTQLSKELKQIETILDKVVLYIKNSYPSERIIQDAIDRLSIETTQRARSIDPSTLVILYMIEALLSEVLTKDTSNLKEPELNAINRKTISDLKDKKDILSSNFDSLISKHNVAIQTLGNYTQELNRLRSLVNQLELDLLRTREKIEHYSKTDQIKQAEIDTLNLAFKKADERLKQMQDQEKYLNEKINIMSEDIYQKQAYIIQLDDQLNQYSGMRKPKGKYIGNLSDKNSKYHFDPKCNHWKMLVGEYVLGLDLSRDIATSNTPVFFIGKLEECDRCSGRKN